MCHLLAQLLCSMLGTSMSYCQSSPQDWTGICCISTTIHSFWDNQGLVWLQYGKSVQLHAFTWLHGLLSTTGDFPLAFPSACTIFSSALWRRHRTWDVAFAASPWLAGHPAGLDLHPASPRLEAQSTHPSWDPLPLVHGDISARPCIAWASKLTRPWWVFPAAGQALEDAWLTGFWLRSSYSFTPSRSSPA